MIFTENIFMKKILSVLFFSIACSSFGQIIKGDMNGDGQLNISDVTQLVNTVIGKQEAQKISLDEGDPYKIDNRSITGTWRTTDGKTLVLNEDGTTNAGSGYTYSFLPNQGYLIILKDNGAFHTAYHVLNKTQDFILMNPIGTNDGLFYYTSANFVTAIKISDTSLKMKTGESYQLTITGEPEDAVIPNLKWTTSSSTIASVDETGKITAKKGGKATITATSVDNADMKVSCSVDITQLVTSVSMSESTLSMSVGDYYDALNATANPSTAQNKTLKWTSSNSAVVKIYDDFIKAIGVGTATITAAATDGSGKKATCKISVFEEAPKSITLTGETTIFYGESTQLTASISPATASSATIKWKSSNEEIATVDQTGKVTAKDKDGKTTITATIAGTNIVESSTMISVREDSPYEYVDLGLSVMWATCNIGASTPQEDGWILAWGDIEPKDSYSWETYFDTKDNGYSFAKYSITKKTRLDPDDDAATVLLGENWHIPTREEWQELIDNCVWVKSWYSYNSSYDSYGYIVYKKKDDSSNYTYSDPHIFLKFITNNRYTYDNYFWTSDLANQSIYAYQMSIRTSGTPDVSYSSRYIGSLIRPVHK